MAAAVADYTPRERAVEKIKKTSDDWSLSFTRTRDILKTLGEQKQPGQILVGFALETEQEEANAQQKLAGKNADMIVLNSLRDAGAGFGHDTNKVTVFDRDGKVYPMALQSKTAAAKDIVNLIIDKLHG